MQDYAWGKVGLASKVAQLAQSGGAPIDDATPYAEFWFGTHASGPSYISKGTDAPLHYVFAKGDKSEGQKLVEATDGVQSLASFLATPEGRAMLGTLPDEYLVPDADGGQQLPFLFKVLSVNKCLSIQAHPDKANAAVLHLRDPEHYGDDNHKPEMSVALTDFEAMCGFRPYEEIVAHASADGAYPEFNQLIESIELHPAGSGDVVAESASVRVAFAKYMDSEKVEDGAFYTSLLEQMVARLAAKSEDAQTRLDKLLVRLSTEYPGDIGVFAPLMLNYMSLKVGEGIFLAANEPHAYLSGDIIECMACSNNVVRAGCTPKFKDVEELKKMLTYTCHRPADLVENPTGEEGGMLTYPAHTSEFVIHATPILAAAQPCTLKTAASASIVLVTEGGGTFITADGAESVAFSAGDVYLMAAGASFAITDAVAGSLVSQVHFCE